MAKSLGLVSMSKRIF
jgi:hypothetical protein